MLTSLLLLCCVGTRYSLQESTRQALRISSCGQSSCVLSRTAALSTPPKSSKSASRSRSSALTSYARPSQGWARPQSSSSQLCTSWMRTPSRALCWSCATLVSLPSRLRKSTTASPSTLTKTRSQWMSCMVASLSSPTSSS